MQFFGLWLRMGVAVTEHRWWILATFDRATDFREAQAVFQRPHPQAAIIRARKGDLAKDWDGNVKFWKASQTTDRGLILKQGFSKRLRKYLDTEDYDYTWDVRYRKGSELDVDPTLLHEIELDDIQKEALEAVLTHRRCDIELKTGSGKTEIFLCAIAAYLKKFPQGKVLVILPKRALLNEAYQRALKRLPNLVDKIGILGDGNFDLRQILFSTPKSIAAEKRDTFTEEVLQQKDAVEKWKEDVGLLILDEVHHAKASGWRKIINECPAEYVWGFSGKVTYFDDIKTMELEEIFGEPVYIGGSLVRRVPVRPVVYNFPDWKDLFKKDGLFPSLVDKCPVIYRDVDRVWKEGFWRGKDANGNLPDILMDGIKKLSHLIGIFDKTGVVRVEPQPDSEDVVYWRPFDMCVMEFAPAYEWAISLAKDCVKAGEPWLISSRRARQLNILEKKIRKALPDVRIGRVDGSMQGKAQHAVFNALQGGDLDGIICQYTIVSEGVDIPRLKHFIKLDNISSEQVLEQQKGRVERISEGKTEGFIHVPLFSQHYSLRKVGDQIMSYYSNLNPVLKYA